MEYVSKHLCAKTLFATHYHELVKLKDRLDAISLRCMKIKDYEGDVIFMHEVISGAADRSYGIHVAKLAGMPKSIVKRANTILNQLETDNRQQGISSKPTAEIASNRDGMQLSFFQLDDPVLCQVRDEILNIDVNNLTPLEALNKLNEIKKIVKGK